MGWQTRQYWRSYSGLGEVLSSETQRPLSTKQICLYLTHMFPNELGLPKESTRSGHEGKEDLDTTFHSAAALSTSKTGSRAAATRSTVVSNIGKVGRSLCPVSREISVHLKLTPSAPRWLSESTIQRYVCFDAAVNSPRHNSSTIMRSTASYLF